MAKRNIMEALNITPDGKHPKKPYDLSSFTTDHSKGGQITVLGVRDTVPDSNYKMSVDSLTRTLLCNTANFAHIKENFYFVHVPLALISRNAYQMLVQREQKYSALNMDITQFPVFNLYDVVTTCLFYGALPFEMLPEKWMDVHGFNICANAIRLLDELGYGYYGDFLMAMRNYYQTRHESYPAETVSDWLTMWLSEEPDVVAPYAHANFYTQLEGLYPSVARIAAYQCVWYNFFRNDIYDNSIGAEIYNFDDVTYVTGGSTPNYDVTNVANRGVDRFIIDCLQMRYNPNKKDLFMSSMPGTQFGAVSTVNLMDNVLLDINIPSSSTQGATVGTAGSTRITVGEDNPTEYSVAVLPPDSDSGEYGRVVSEYAPSAATNVGFKYSHTHSINGGITTTTMSGGTSLFDVLSLVESQAIQKWRQKSMLAGNKTIDQFRAHHGVVPKHLIDHLPDFIGSVDNEIMIKEITSQANTLNANEGENNLGEIRGRGYAVSDGRSFNFYSDDYGVLLLLHSVVPENTYSSFGMDKGNMMIYYNDFFQQEFENIGLETVPKILLNTMARYPFPEKVHGTGIDDFADTTDEGNVGYAPRNYGYKQYQSKVHGLFNPTRVTDNGPFAPVYSNIFGYADMQSFVLTRTDMVGRMSTSSVSPTPSLTMSLSKLYVNPSLFDSIFSFKADDWYDSDPFITHARFNCQAMLPMSVTGLPQF